jgi:hypothetical protein
VKAKNVKKRETKPTTKQNQKKTTTKKQSQRNKPGEER